MGHPQSLELIPPQSITMELDRPHRPAASTTSDLFICFTSRLSHSSSMRLSSTKSILSPGRTDKPPVSLPTSLSRRLRSNNGSLKGGQSPMFPPGVSKKRGCAFDNPEPSSPKVTCIGQVRVKTKKQGKKMKLAYKPRRSGGGGGGGGGDVSFRRIEGSANQESQQQDKNNQSWVHLPLTICDALSCFVPCRSSCSSGTEGNRRVKPEREKNNSSSSSSCGGGVLRWMMAFHEGEGKTRDFELVVEEEEEVNRGGEERVMERECSRRRSIFDDMDFSIDEIGNGGDEGKEGTARVSICIPPKNALLLMRCRSDPVKMSALATKFLVSQPAEEDEIEEETGEERRNSVREDEKIESFFSSAEENEVRERLEEGEEEVQVGRCSIDSRDVERVRVSVSEDEVSSLAMLFEDPDEMEDEAICQFHDPPESAPPIEHQEEEEDDEDEDLVEIQVTVIGKDSIFEQIEDFSNQLPPLEGAEKEEDQDKPPAEEEEEDEQTIPENQSRSEEQSTVSEEDEEEEKQLGKPVLPDCSLLMMCEPKLSMEVSKETWVCSTDFIRWLPESHRQHQLKKIAGGDEPNKARKNKKKNRASVEPNPPLPPAPAVFQPPRSSCSFPISMASLIEKKLVSAVAYEPFVLTRCKSEPMRSATAKFGAAQELACFWKNRKIEPHRPATCAIGAGGVGF